MSGYFTHKRTLLEGKTYSQVSGRNWNQELENFCLQAQLLSEQLLNYLLYLWLTLFPLHKKGR